MSLNSIILELIRKVDNQWVIALIFGLYLSFLVVCFFFGINKIVEAFV